MEQASLSLSVNVRQMLLYLYKFANETLYSCHQAIRYLMRFQTQYMCGLMNVARNAAFGKEVAKMFLTSLGKEWPKVLLIYNLVHLPVIENINLKS